jgi:hypothetical protein
VVLQDTLCCIQDRGGAVIKCKIQRSAVSVVYLLEQFKAKTELRVSIYSLLSSTFLNRHTVLQSDSSRSSRNVSSSQGRHA